MRIDNAPSHATSLTRRRDEFDFSYVSELPRRLLVSSQANISIYLDRLVCGRRNGNTTLLLSPEIHWLISDLATLGS